MMSCGSKRSYSFSNYTNSSSVTLNNKVGPDKKRKKLYKRGSTFVPPTKFLLGGNIRDPLNLNGLPEEDESAPREEVVRKDVLLPTTDFLLGGNINDPLNLKGIVDLEENKRKQEKLSTGNIKEIAEGFDSESTLQRVSGGSESSAVKHDDPCSSRVEEPIPGSDEDLKIQLKLQISKKLDRKDKIVSPVIPQPYRPLKTFPFRQIITPDLAQKPQKTPKFKEKNTMFQYGNYRNQYRYRNSEKGVDLRLEVLEKHRELFENKDVLDVGCNIGHVSFVIARNFAARSVIGIDIDRSLIEIARKNVQFYVNCPSPYSLESPNPAAAASATGSSCSSSSNLKYKCYPVSMPILYGPIMDLDLKNGGNGSPHRIFPQNIRFIHGNYVSEFEYVEGATQAQFDAILCLSVTKWIHLNWGDEGLKLAFKKMYSQLRPGGVLVLEPQSWDSYKKKKNLTETIWRNYQNIQLFPHHFDRYLLSSEIGFSRCQTLAVMNHQFKGFRRAIKVFRKPFSANKRVRIEPVQNVSKE